MKRILFDQISRWPRDQDGVLKFKMGWHKLKNGDLIEAAEAQFDALIISNDRNWKYQQRITDRRIAIIILPSGNWPILQPRVDDVVRAVDSAKLGNLIEL